MEQLLSYTVPPQGMRSAIDAELLRSGEWALIQGLRWDTGQMTVRGGTALYLNGPENNVDMTLVDLIPVTLNGTHYLLGFYLKGGLVRVYWSSNASMWLELTEVGGLSGGTSGTTRFATNTGRFTVSVVKAPQGFFGGAITPSRDVAIISNGADQIRLWDPGRGVVDTHTVTGIVGSGGLCRVTFSGNHSRNTGDTITITGVLGTTEANGSWTVTRISGTVLDLQLSTFASAYVSGGTATTDLRFTIHQPVNVPIDAGVFMQKATFANFWNLRSGTKTYFSSAGPPIVNDSTATDQFYLSSATGVGSSSATTPLIVWGWGTTAAATQIATVYRPAQPLSMGKGLILGTEDILATFGADFMLSHVKIETNRIDAVYNDASVTPEWKTLYDPSSTDDRLRRFEALTIANSVTSELPRKQWFFPCDHYEDADKTIYHIRFTRLTDAPAPASFAQVVFLYMCGAGDIPGATVAQISYEYEPGRAESRRIVPSNGLAASFADIGGPITVNSAQGIFSIPISTSTFYDYSLTIRNSDAATPIEGGLGGEPSRVNLYLQCPTEDGLETTARYIYSFNLWNPGAFAAPFIGYGWTKIFPDAAFVHNTSSVTDLYDIDWNDRQIDRFSPSDFQITIPRCYASIAKNGRLIVGNVLDEADQRQRGDGYFSGYAQPFRFQALVESDVTGGRFTADAEEIQAFVSSSAGSQGVSHIHVITDKWTYLLGGSGSQTQTPLDSYGLQVLSPAIGRGTRAHRSVCENEGAIFYLDNTGQYVKLLDGATELSRLQVDDKFAGIPNGRLASVCGAVFRSRVYIPYSASGATTNRQCLGWHDRMERWEFDDATPFDFERICVYYDNAANGSGQRLIFGTKAGILYQYEIGTQDVGSSIAIRLTSRAIASPADDRPCQLEWFELDLTAQDSSLTLDRVLSSPTGTYRTTLDVDDGWVTDKNKDHTKTAQVADQGDEWSRVVQADIYGNLLGGSKIKKIAANVELSTSHHSAANPS